jgi:glycosyltransferase involved in cell wall biosynthesis
LQSIHKNLVGWSEIVICIPTGQESLLSHLTSEKVVTCKTYKQDYIGQQISKLEAYKHCKGDYIFFVDSDVVFYKGADIRDYFSDNKPVILYDKYENVGEAICWKPIVEKLFKDNVEYEFMRRPGQLFHKSTLENFATNFPDIENYGINQPNRDFSEFNYLGFFAWKHEPENYKFVNLETEPIPKTHCKQYWSYSNLTEQEKLEIENTI